jgi:hypothetical protein
MAWQTHAHCKWHGYLVQTRFSVGALQQRLLEVCNLLAQLLGFYPKAGVFHLEPRHFRAMCIQHSILEKQSDSCTRKFVKREPV